jgi:hypothetical protein
MILVVQYYTILNWNTLLRTTVNWDSAQDEIRVGGGIYQINYVSGQMLHKLLIDITTIPKLMIGNEYIGGLSI